METVDNRNLKQKVHDAYVNAKEKVSETWNGAVTACKEHPMEAFTIACITVPGILKIGNSLIRANIQAKETRYNECDIYDPRTGTHYYTKRPLSNKQKLNLEARYRDGEDKGKVLYDMHML